MDGSSNGQWPTIPLGEVATLVMGQAPTGGSVQDWDEESDGKHTAGLPFIQGNAEFGTRFPKPTKWCEQPSKVARAGDFLISVRAPVGDLNQADQSLAIGRGLAAIRFHGVDERFGWQSLWEARKAFARVSQGSTFEAINARDLATLAIPVPPPLMQTRIGEVLDAIDLAIEKTEAVIEATETLRKALLQELLTRGIPGWHSEWKTVPGIGTIPARWEVVKLGEVTSEFQYGTSSKSGSDVTGVPVLRIPNVARGTLDLTDLKYGLLPKRELDSLRLRDGDLLFVRTNGNPDICGRVAHVSGLRGDWAFASYIVRTRTHQRLAPLFLWHYLSQENGRRALAKHIRTSAGNFNLSVSGVRQLDIPLPLPEEQLRICELVGALEERIRQERQVLTHLRAIKRETASVLLSGRVRVPVGVGDA